jgi:hypothetical protein
MRRTKGKVADQNKLLNNSRKKACTIEEENFQRLMGTPRV